MVAVFAHEVYARQIKLYPTGRTPRNVEYARIMRIAEFGDFLEFGFRFLAVRVDEAPILKV